MVVYYIINTVPGIHVTLKTKVLSTKQCLVCMYGLSKISLIQQMTVFPFSFTLLGLVEVKAKTPSSENLTQYFTPN